MIDVLKDYCRGKNWWIRLPLVLGSGYLVWQYLSVDGYYSFVDMVNFVIHEVGHVVLGITGNEVLGFVGGSFFQLLFPILAMINFWWIRDYFSIFLAKVWLGISMVDVGNYMSDATVMQTPLVPLLSPDPIHDWNWIFIRFGLLEYDTLIGGSVVWIGKGLMVLGLLWGMGILVGMWLLKRETDVESNLTRIASSRVSRNSCNDD